MIGAIAFSRDRACQLDLLLRSLEENASGVFDPVFVIWHATSEEFREGYQRCVGEHPDVAWIKEDGLTYQTHHCITASGRLVAFFTDDDVLYRPLDRAAIYEHALNREDVLCFSLRLGHNTTFCYPHGRRQQLPRQFSWNGDLLLWEWQRAEQDWSYPFSLDGHLYRRADLLALLDGRNFSTPNFLEETLMSDPASLRRPLMAAYSESRLVSIPANIVSQSHMNRHGQEHPMSTAVLNERYLAGEQIDLASMNFSGVRGAHHELPYVFT